MSPTTLGVQRPGSNHPPGDSPTSYGSMSLTVKTCPAGKHRETHPFHKNAIAPCGLRSLPPPWCLWSIGCLHSVIYSKLHSRGSDIAFNP
ncbi:hypothetical protein PoB_006438400 [Plakobranchus ocellatus]|uniref:Uncharacterized protein n=1 Tax=Plakobranchus ocellatus TaxID=259542 RepID=A0AAV4D1A4_9GAST|nr:hypothetical protein PoB_006438400 [Plakobranchus ocellatus]